MYHLTTFLYNLRMFISLKNYFHHLLMVNELAKLGLCAQDIAVLVRVGEFSVY